ncbi:porin (plasmid) [Burkholderia sp. JP2-270]|uniref:porin n=1 Tax=Burkholderia sp. JP2-270 TaxID=2217913 RepID=UPI000DA32E33|nr:porin [Burkholderia sp. JP2-270]AWV05679.1 porin [Burkholderia sp. JP2-270]
MFNEQRNQSVIETTSIRICAILTSSIIFSVAHAESNVTLYGVIDTGIDYANSEVKASNGQIVPNSGGHVFQMSSGVPWGSRWGMVGKEDLGGGLKAIFRLESGFNSVNGSLGGNNQLFSRNAYVGLQSDSLGTLTFGKQWDTIVDMLEPFSLNGNYGGWYFAHPNDMDNMDNGFSVNNAVKYVSPSFGGLQFEGHYSLGGQAGQFSNQASYSAGATYRFQGLAAGVAYLRVNNPGVAIASYQSGGGFVNTVYGSALEQARSQSVLATGLSYQFDKVKLLGNFTYTTFQHGDAGQNVTFQNYELAAIYSLSENLALAGGYTYTAGRDHATDSTPKYQQINLIAQYSLSKRTDIYAMAALQRASGDAQFAQIAGLNPSSTNKQSVVRLGMTHHF